MTKLLPGEVFPVARALHRWEAILAVLAILTWHIYNGCIKDKNRGIFTGLMSEAEMQHMHPLECQRIVRAVEYLKKTTAVNGSTPLATASMEELERGSATPIGGAD